MIGDGAKKTDTILIFVTRRVKKRIIYILLGGAGGGGSCRTGDGAGDGVFGAGDGVFGVGAKKSKVNKNSKISSWPVFGHPVFPRKLFLSNIYF